MASLGLGSWALPPLLTLGGVFHLDGHDGALRRRVTAQGVAVLSLDARRGGVQFHVQERALLVQHRVIKETAEQVVGEVLHVLCKVVQVLGEVLGEEEGGRGGQLIHRGPRVNNKRALAKAICHLATHSRILAWKIPWAEEPGGLQSIGSPRVAHD